MRKFIDIITEDVSPEIEAFLHTLSTDDVGVEEIGGFTVRFEGFTDQCWEDAEEKGKTIDGLEREMIADWQGRHPGLELVDSGWTYGDEYWTDTTFYAIFRGKA